MAINLVEVSPKQNSEFSRKGVYYCISKQTITVYCENDDFRKKAKHFLAEQAKANNWGIVRDVTEDGKRYIKEFTNVDIDLDDYNALIDALEVYYAACIEVYKEAKRAKEERLAKKAEEMAKAENK